MQAQIVARKEPDKAATNAQRDDLKAEKQKSIDGLVTTLPRTVVSASFIVLDVLRRPDAEPDGKILVVGRLDWSPPTVLSDADHKSRIAAVNAKADGEIAYQRKELSELHSGSKSKVEDSEVESMNKRIAGIEAERKKATIAIKDAAEAAKPSHIVFCLSDNEALLNWKRDQRRAVKGVIYKSFLSTAAQRAGMTTEVAKMHENERESGDARVGPRPELVTEDDAAIYVGSETAIKVFDRDLPQGQ